LSLRIRPRLLFEVTESTEIRKLEQVNTVLQNLRGRGHKVCLDDFAPGRIVPYLQAFLVDYVRSTAPISPHPGQFPRPHHREGDGANVLELGISTIAEMIETRSRPAASIGLGVGYGQGYLYGKPAGGDRQRHAHVRPATQS